MPATLACYAVIERHGGLDDLAPWPHWRGALPSEEERADFVAPTSETHPFRRGEFMRRIRLHGELDAMEVGTVIAEVARYNRVLRDDDGRVGEALRAVERDLAGFAKGVARWAEAMVPERAADLTGKVVGDFALVTNAV